MCGRATLRVKLDQLRTAFALTEIPTLVPRFNICPTQPMAIIRKPHRLEFLRWGLVLKDHAKGSQGINVRAESVARAPQYRDSFQSRRCLVIVDGFYEWKRDGKKKTPFFVHFPDDRSFALAGIWDECVTQDGEVLDACAVITTQAKGIVATLHDRMPLIVPPENYDTWLDETKANATSLLVNSGDALAAHAVSTLVNSPANDDASCVLPIADRQWRIGETGKLF